MEHPVVKAVLGEGYESADALIIPNILGLGPKAMLEMEMARIGADNAKEAVEALKTTLYSDGFLVESPDFVLCVEVGEDIVASGYRKYDGGIFQVPVMVAFRNLGLRCDA